MSRSSWCERIARTLGSRKRRTEPRRRPETSGEWFVRTRLPETTGSCRRVPLCRRGCGSRARRAWRCRSRASPAPWCSPAGAASRTGP